MMIDFDEFGPEKILTVYDPNTGMRGVVVIDSTVLGPGKGGIRMTSTVDAEEVARLARSMTWKCALAELPFGGAKAGLIADSKGIGSAKKKEMVEAFSTSIQPLCPESYVAAPDMYMGEKEMVWFAEANGNPRSCTGKPESMGGIPHELGGTGFGVFQATRVSAELMGIDLKKATFALEGFGSVGRPLAKYMIEAGTKFVAVSDSQGTLSDAKGLSYERLETLKQQGRSVIEYAEDAGGQVCNLKSCDRILDIEADILITAAKSDLIKSNDVNRLNFKLIVQGSNIPMSFWVENMCHKKNIMVVPDFVANAGGVISSYVEYINADPMETFDLIEKKIASNTQTVIQESLDKKRMPRKTALNLARERVMNEKHRFGVIP